jgi:hypothetical protein
VLNVDQPLAAAVAAAGRRYPVPTLIVVSLVHIFPAGVVRRPASHEPGHRLKVGRLAGVLPGEEVRVEVLRRDEKVPGWLKADEIQ